MEWREVKYFPKYEVSNLGQVRHNRTLRYLQPQMNQFGVPYVGLMRDEGTHHNRSLPLLVANAFIPQEFPLFDTPINCDWDRWNCSVENLMWRPRWFAIRYHQQAKEPYHTPIEVPVGPIDSEDVFPSSREASKAYGLLERDVVMSIANNTYAWPTYQMFQMKDSEIAYYGA